MADTVAVMNHGRDRADGRPGELYENPRTDLRRQLPRPVQPHRGRGSSPVRRRRDGRHRRRRRRDPGRRAQKPTGDGAVGVRPEKVRSSTPSTPDAGPGRTATCSRDASPMSRFSGVSTQYLVRMPWGQELIVFAQNIGHRRPLAQSATRSCWTGRRSTPSGSTQRRHDARARHRGRRRSRRQRRR